MENETKLYQPFLYTDDGTNIDYGNMPEELASFMAFRSREGCIGWLEDNDYDPSEYAIVEYNYDDIEEPTIIDADGYFENGEGSVSCYNTEKDLDEGYDQLIDYVEDAQEQTGESLIVLSCPVMLYEDEETLAMDDAKSNARPNIISIDTTAGYTIDGRIVPLENITDYDDYMMLVDAISLTAHGA